MRRLNFLGDINHFLTSLSFSLVFSLPQDYLNVRGHISAYVRQTEGPGGANRRWNCDCCRPDTLGGGNQSQADYGCFKNPGESLSVNEYLAPTARVTPVYVCDTSGVWANAEEFWPPRPQSVMWKGIRKLTHYWILWRLQS